MILRNYMLIPLRSTPSLTSSTIVQAAKNQNIWCNDSMITILRGVSDLDAPLTCSHNNGVTSTLRTFLKDQCVPFKDVSPLRSCLNK